MSAAVLPPLSGDTSPTCPADLVGRVVTALLTNGVCLVRVRVTDVGESLGRPRLHYDVAGGHGNATVELASIGHLHVAGTADDPDPTRVWAPGWYVHLGGVGRMDEHPDGAALYRTGERGPAPRHEPHHGPPPVTPLVRLAYLEARGYDEVRLAELATSRLMLAPEPGTRLAGWLQRLAVDLDPNQRRVQVGVWVGEPGAAERGQVRHAVLEVDCTGQVSLRLGA